MKLIYVTSWYPTQNDTFVIREIEEITKAGHTVEICVLRPGKGSVSATPVTGERISISQISLSLGDVARALLSCLVRRSLWVCLAEAAGASLRQPRRATDIMYVLFATAYFAADRSRAGASYVHAHFLHVGAIASRWLGMMLGLPYGVTAHTSLVRFDGRLMTKVVRESAVCVGDTFETVGLLREMGNERTALVRNGIPVSKIVFRGPAPTAQAQECPIILAVGTLIPPKGFATLLAACELLKKEGVSFRCRLIGEGPERGPLEKLGRDLRASGHLEMPGAMPIQDLLEEYRKAAVFVMASVPSEHGRDGLPTVIIEAMAFGVPVVATKHAAIPELVRDGGTGYLVPPLDSEALARALVHCLSDDESRREMCARARRVIEEEYDLSRNVRKLLALIARGGGFEEEAA